MSKGIIVVEKVPESCSLCHFAKAEYGKYCHIADEPITLECGEKKPDWCPIKSVLIQKKTDTAQGDSYNDGWINGYNNCVEKVSKVLN